MSVKVHEVKSWEPFFSAMARKDKTFDIRNDDRAYALGDVLKHHQVLVCETCGGTGVSRHDPTRVCATCHYNDRLRDGGAEPIYTVVNYIMRGGRFGLAPGFIAMSVKRVWPHIIETPQENEIVDKKIVYLPVFDPRPGSKHCPRLEQGQTIYPLSKAVESHQLPLFPECAN